MSGALPLRAAEVDQQKAAARAAFERGIACGTAPCACQNFEASVLLYERPSTWVKVGLCKRERNDNAAAWSAFARAHELNQQDSATFRPELQREIEEEQAKTPRLKLELSEPLPGLEVFLDGTRIDIKAGEEVGIARGEHEVETRATGREPNKAVLVVDAPRAYRIPLPVDSTTNEVQVESTPSVLTTDSLASNGSTQRVAGIVVGGAGVVALGLAAFFGVKTLKLVDQSEPYCGSEGCDREGKNLLDRASGTQTAGILLGVGGALAAAGGCALYFTAAPSSTTGAATSPRLGLGLEGLGVRGGVWW
jgi:hypothetical protein